MNIILMSRMIQYFEDKDNVYYNNLKIARWNVNIVYM